MNFPKAPPLDIAKLKHTIKLSELYKNIQKLHKQKESGRTFDNVGEMILSLFKEVSKNCDSVTVEWSKEYALNGVENVTIKTETMSSISIKAVKAFHSLYIL